MPGANEHDAIEAMRVQAEGEPLPPLPPKEPVEPTDTFEALAADPELTPEKLQEELTNYMTALRQEFEDKTAEAPENVQEHTSEFFKANVPNAAAQIAWLSINADSESVRLNASKMVIALALKDEQDKQDPLKDLLKGLTANDKSSPAPQES